jgi:hypothetical protein
MILIDCLNFENINKNVKYDWGMKKRDILTLLLIVLFIILLSEIVDHRSQPIENKFLT